MTDDAAQNVAAALDLLGLEPKIGRRGFVDARCPLAHRRHASGTDQNPSYGVLYRQRGRNPAGHGTCLSCHLNGSLLDAAALLFTYGDIDAQTFTAVQEALEGVNTAAPLSLGSLEPQDDPEFPESFLSAYYPVSFKSTPWAAQYLDQRGVARSVVERFDLRADPMQGRVIVPIRDYAGTLRGVVGRSTIPDAKLRYLHYKVSDAEGSARGFTWFGENLIDVSKPVVVCEGSFDVMSVTRAYANAVGTMGTAVRKPVRTWWLNVTRWITMFDAGPSGDVARQRFERLVLGRGSSVRVYHLSPPAGKKDPGECTPSEITDSLKSLVHSRLSL